MQSAVYVAVLLLLGQASSILPIKKPEASTSTSSAKLQSMPRSLEVRFALSALPLHLRDEATTYVLDPAKGYVLAHKGTNGISCVVVRSDWQWPDRPFRNDIFWAVCYDAEGAKTLLRDYFYTAELRATGLSAKQTHEEVVKKFGTASYPNPARPGVAYMIAPVMRGFPGNITATRPVTMNMPHYMFYAPNVTDADIGGQPYSQYPFILSMSRGRDDVIIVLVGKSEKAKILQESKDLLAELCSYRDDLCTTKVARGQTPVR